jgi:flagellum-specific peptidoglycan hydrolase FlgJ
MKRLIALIMFAASLTPLMAQYTDADVEAYVEKYKDYAIQAQEKYKIPASIKLAQAIYSSACGTNRLATEGLNHFGITCRGGWSGETFYYDNIHTTADDCFRKYASVEASYQNHSVFLASRERYADLFKLDITDYKGWANGLFKAGYAGNPSYPQKLINLIEKYHLDRFDNPKKEVVEEVVVEEKPVAQPVDKIVLETSEIKPVETVAAKEELTPTLVEKKVEEPVKEAPKAEPAKQEPVKQEPVKQEPAKVETTTETYYENNIEVIVERQVQPAKPVKVSDKLPAPSAQIIQTIFTATKDDFRQIYYPYTNRPVYENNKTSFLIARSGDTYAKIAKEVKIGEGNLRAYNDVFDETYEPISGEVIYLEPKNTKSAVAYHTMKEGESFRFLSQKYAIQLKTLLKRNGYAPAAFGVGDKICISCK